MVLEGGAKCLLMRQEFEFEESDEGLGVVYQVYCIDLYREYSPGL